MKYIWYSPQESKYPLYILKIIAVILASSANQDESQHYAVFHLGVYVCQIIRLYINILYTGNPLTGTLANSVDPDEM